MFVNIYNTNGKYEGICLVAKGDRVNTRKLGMSTCASLVETTTIEEAAELLKSATVVFSAQKSTSAVEGHRKKLCALILGVQEGKNLYDAEKDVIIVPEPEEEERPDDSEEPTVEHPFKESLLVAVEEGRAIIMREELSLEWENAKPNLFESKKTVDTLVKSLDKVHMYSAIMARPER